MIENDNEGFKYKVKNSNRLKDNFLFLLKQQKITQKL